MRNKFDEAHRKPGSGLAGVVLALAIAPMIAFSPVGREAYNAVEKYLSERIVMPSEHEQTEQINSRYSR